MEICEKMISLEVHCSWRRILCKCMAYNNEWQSIWFVCNSPLSLCI